MRILYLLVIGLLFSFNSTAQIPVREYIPNTFKLDTQFHRQARDTGFSLFFNRWVQEADMNNDGKLDLIIQPYDHPTRRDGVVSIFYNHSSSNIPVFKNNSRDNFYTLGDVSQFSVGDINGDGKKDILTPTQNYHGTPNNMPLHLYPNGCCHTPDKFWLQRDTGFQRFVFPDNHGTESGNLIRLGDGLQHILITNYNTPTTTSPFQNSGNLLYKYEFNNDTSQLIPKATFFGGNAGYFQRIGAIRHIGAEDSVYNYFSLEKFRQDGLGIDSLLIISFLKEDSLNIFNAVDTLAAIKYRPDTSNGYPHMYRAVVDWGIYVIDLDNNGTKEVITHEYTNYAGPLIVGSSPSHTRIQVYNKTGNITSSWIDPNVIYDPQQVSHGNGISVVDINGDGLPDVLPYTGWGWWSWSSQEYISLEPERRKKRIFLNTGSRFKAFLIDFSGYTTDFINQEVGYAHPYAFPLEPNSSERSILILKGHIGGSSFINPRWDTLSAVPALKLDFSQFKFPCSLNQPKYILTGKTNFCNNDSSILKIDSVVGYKTRWYINDQLVNSSNSIVIKETNNIKLSITNLGGCTSEKLIQITKYPVPSPPSLSRDVDNNLVSNSIGNIWYKDGVKIADTTQKIKPTSNGIYTATTTQNGCTSSISEGYYYLTNAVSNLSNGEYFRISPNPTSGELNINYRFSSSKDVYISVIDMNGRNLIMNRKINSGSKINIGSFSKGSYFIQVKDKAGRLITSQKVVKE